MRENQYSVPIRSLTSEEEIMTDILRVANRFRTVSDQGLRNFGLTLMQYNVLRILADSENGKNIMGNINKMMMFSKANMTLLARRLEQGGFVITRRDDFDDRSKVMEITPRGKQKLRDIREEALQHVNGYLKGFSSNEKTELRRMIIKIISTIERT